jgi:hypothetical protein
MKRFLQGILREELPQYLQGKCSDCLLGAGASSADAAV